MKRLQTLTPLAPLHQPFNLRGVAEGVLAYGFHGLSYDYIASVLRAKEGPQAGGRTIVLHLGSGVSSWTRMQTTAGQD